MDPSDHPSSPLERDESSSQASEIDRLLRHSDYLLTLSMEAHRRAEAASRKIAEVLEASRALFLRNRMPASLKPPIAPVDEKES